jgi:aspartate dehydrogenase
MVDVIATQPRQQRIAVVGAGAIGRQLVLGVARGDAGSARVVAIAETPDRGEALESLAASLGVAGGAPALLTDARRVSELEPDVVVEAAGPSVVRDHTESWLASGCDVLVMSVGALADAGLLSRIEAAARASGHSVLVPSGAIGGLDAVRAARLAGLDAVELRTTKPPRSLTGAPGIVAAGVDLDTLTVPTIVFEGNALEAVVAFPANLNVVAALSLAGLGPERTRVVLVAEPGETRNVHEIRARGAFGELTLRFANLPSAENPKTSALAPFAALALLRRRAEAIQVGS